MTTRRRDGEYRINEFDPETVHRLAVELLNAFAKDPGAAQIADLDVYLPDVTWLATTDRERDDLADAIYEACGQARIVIPSATGGSVTSHLLNIIQVLAGTYENLAKSVAVHLPEDVRTALAERATHVLTELPIEVNRALAGEGD